VASTRDAFRRRRARRSTLAAVGGLLLIALGVILTVARVGSDLLPTVLALAGLVSLIAGIVTGQRLVVENIRYHRDQSYYDE
jgi:hypothetical protein